MSERDGGWDQLLAEDEDALGAGPGERRRALAGALALMASPPAISRAEAQVLSAAVARQLTARRRRRRAVVAGAAGLALAASLVAAVWLAPWRAAAPPTFIDISGGELALDGGRPARQGSRIDAGHFFIAKSSVAKLRVGPAVELELRRGARARVSLAKPGQSELELASGAVKASIDPAVRMRFSVITPRCRVEVKGTVFSVEVTDDDVLVKVQRGAVEVSGQTAPAVRLGAGSSWSVRGAPPVETPRLERKTERGRDPEPVTAEPATPTTSHAAAGSRPAMPHDASSRHQQHSKARRSEPARNQLPAEQTEKGHVEKVPSADALTFGLLQQARQCRSRRDWSGAARLYGELLRRSPRGGAAQLARVALAELELEQLRQASRALEHFSECLKLEPAGPLAEEAAFGKTRALRSLGRRAEERVATLDFLTRYPRSIHAARLRARLRELQEER